MGNGIFSPYGSSKKYFALCTPPVPPATDYTISMYQCAKGADFDRSVAVSACVFKCPTADGKFEYSLDETKYFNCLKGSATIETCPEGSIFVPKDKDCGFGFRRKMRIL